MGSGGSRAAWASAAAVVTAAALAGCHAGESASGGDGAAPGSGTGGAAAEDGAGDRAEVVLTGTAADIEGSERDLSAYRGRVVLIVNTASRCGFTRQYAALEELYRDKAERGFVVLGFPANNFGGQEPGTNAEIAAFCDTHFGVTFPMFAKVDVVGESAHPLFTALSERSEAPTWNFTKYLLDREGRLVARFGPRTAPDDEAVVTAIDRLLES